MAGSYCAYSPSAWPMPWTMPPWIWPFEQRVVDDPAAVVDPGVARKLHRAGLGIDLDLGDVRPARIRARLRQVAARVERMRRLPGMPAHDLLEADRQVRPLHAIAAVGELHVGRPDFERLRGEVRPLAHRFPHRHRDRAALGHHRARADRAVAHQRRAVGIARPQRDPLRVHAEDLGRDFRVHGLVTLARAAGDGEELGVARRAEADLRLLLRAAAGAGRLDEHRAADPAQLAARPGLGAPGLEALPVGLLQRHVDVAVRIAAVVLRHRQRRLVRELVLAEQVRAGAARSGRRPFRAPPPRPGARRCTRRSAVRRPDRPWSAWCWSAPAGGGRTAPESGTGWWRGSPAAGC